MAARASDWSCATVIWSHRRGMLEAIGAGAATGSSRPSVTEAAAAGVDTPRNGGQSRQAQRREREQLAHDRLANHLATTCPQDGRDAWGIFAEINVAHLQHLSWHAENPSMLRCIDSALKGKVVRRRRLSMAMEARSSPSSASTPRLRKPPAQRPFRPGAPSERRVAAEQHQPHLAPRPACAWLSALIGRAGGRRLPGGRTARLR